MRLSHLFEAVEIYALDVPPGTKVVSERSNRSWDLLAAYYAGSTGMYLLFKEEDGTPGVRKPMWKLSWHKVEEGIGGRIVVPPRNSLDGSGYAGDWSHYPDESEILRVIRQWES